MVDRDKKLTIRIAEVELSMLEALAEADGVSQSDYVRLFIRRVRGEIPREAVQETMIREWPPRRRQPSEGLGQTPT